MADLDYLINFDSNTSGIDKSKFAISKLGAAMAALGVGFGASELASVADEFSNVAAFINIAVGETGNFEQAMTGVKEVALATNTNLTATTQLFYKINEAGKQMGLTQQDSLELTETINKAMQLGGGAAASNEAAIIQLTQALQSGVLRGEEFNSIMEQAPGISKALAASLGVTTGDLRAMANEGKLSAQTVIAALQEQSTVIASEFDKLPITVEKALQNIRTQWMVLIGEFNQDSGATSKVVEWLGVLEENMALLDTVLADVGEGVEWIGDQLSKVDTETIVAMKQAFESAYEALKSFATAMADGFELAVENLDVTLGMLFDFESGLTDAESKTGGFTKAIQALNVALGFIGDGFAGISIASKLVTGAFYDMAAAWYQLKSNFSFGAVKDEAIADMQAMATKAQEMYGQASNAALDFKSKGVAAIEDLSKTEAQLNAETLADLKATFAEKSQAYQDLAITEGEYAAKSVALEKSKLEAAQEYAQAAVDGNNGVIDSAT
ncbi:tape measure protein, partial [Psychrobacter sp.]|uniref:tape measure protein n=1 Tax=Psychrobacter sp. TaxID=56811 RepID=UPI0035655F44